MKLAEKQRYKDMITVNFYPEEVASFIKMLDWAIENAKKRKDRDDWEMADKWKRNIKLIYDNWKEKQ